MYPNFIGWSGPSWPTAASKWDPLVVEVSSDASGMIYLGAYAWGSGTPINGIEVSAPVTGSQDDIPEPATLALVGLAACGLGGYVRRRRKV